MGLTDQEINDEFCKEAGIKKACCYILNLDTGDMKYYANTSGMYKTPKGWTNIEKGKFEPRYPDLINNPINFVLLLNIQWYMFGELGDVYRKTGEESFQCNYVKTRLKALKMCRTLGATNGMLEVYKEKLRELPFVYMDDITLYMGED